MAKRPKPGDRVTLAEISDLLDVPTSTLRNWRARPDFGFPASVGKHGRAKQYLWGKVDRWWQTDPIPKPGRKPADR